MRKTISVKFFARRDRALNNGLVPIFMRIERQRLNKAGAKRMVVESKETTATLFDVYSAIYRNKNLNASHTPLI